MDVVEVLQELAKHPLADEAFARAARALVLAGPLPAQSSAATPLPGPANIAPAPGEPPGAPGPARRIRDQSRVVRITVRDAAGHRTTACLQRGFHDAAAQRLGGEAKLVELVKQLSRQAPLEVANRSGWVQDRIEQRMQAGRDTRTPDMFAARASPV